MPWSAPRALSLFYLTSFAVLGAHLPYFNLYLKARGFSAAQIGVLSALMPLFGILAPAAGGMLADRSGRRRALIIGSTMAAFLSFLLVPWATGFVGMAAAIGLYAALRAPALPLVEATAMEVSEGGGPAYGRMRVWGSAAFILTALVAGRAVGVWGEAIVVPTMLGLLGLHAAATLLLPGDAVPPPVSRVTGLLPLILRREAVLFLLACMLSQVSHGPYYVFYSIHLEAAGYTPTRIGALWALAVLCEMAVMLGVRRHLVRHGTRGVLILALGLAALRWTLCASSTALWVMVAAQALHAFTFGAFHVAAVTHTHRLFGEDRRAVGQAITSSVTYGAGNVLGMLASGAWLERAGMTGLFLGAALTALTGALVLIATRRGVAPRAGEGSQVGL